MHLLKDKFSKKCNFLVSLTMDVMKGGLVVELEGVIILYMNDLYLICIPFPKITI